MKKTVIILPFLLAAQINPNITVASATVSDGVAAYEAGDYVRAREEWLPYAALGNPNALYNLGQLYRMGRGIEQNYKKAEEYYLRAAEKGHVGAQRNLGTLHYFGRLGQIDMEQAYKWLYRAAGNGDARSQYIVGTMYYNGQHVARNTTEAYAWIHLSAEQGIRDARMAQDKLKTHLDSRIIQAALARAPGLVGSYRVADDRDLMVDGQSEQDNEETAALALPAEEKAATAVAEKTETLTSTLPAESSAQPDIMASDNFRVQVGSFRSGEEADRTLARLKEKHADLIGDHEAVVQIVDIKDRGIFYRLQLRPFESRETANDLCARLKENGIDCYSLKTPPQS
ncbi:SPOR domain-containing protein [Emcibacter sp.]|uniref:SPOR domain-containing protein n=1 Tax=Emcibacter sp. TaxID=1979954 RepID=UPI003A902CC2